MRAVGAAVHGRHAAPHRAGSQRHQQLGALADGPQRLGVALGEDGAFHQRDIQLAVGLVLRRGHQEIANIDQGHQVQKLVLAIQDDKLVSRAAGQTENANCWFAHQIISGRLMASQ